MSKKTKKCTHKLPLSKDPFVKCAWCGEMVKNEDIDFKFNLVHKLNEYVKNPEESLKKLSKEIKESRDVKP